MDTLSRRRAIGAFAALLAVSAVAEPQDRGGHPAGDTVYTMSNAADANRILVFVRPPRGELLAAGSHLTGGRGTGGGLGNQGGLVLTPDERFLLAVNAGSDDVSVFAVRGSTLRLIGATPSGGSRPISIAVDRDLVYVLNAGSDDIAGFRLGQHGRLTPLAGSRRELSGAGTDPAQISFSADGRTLVVTEKATNNLVTFPLDLDGLAETRLVFASPGQTPFGFALGKHRQLVVSEAAGGAPNASSMTSWRLTREGVLNVIDPTVPTQQSAACWVVITPNGRFAYTSNTGSATISGFRITPAGRLLPLDADGVTASTGAGPIDLALDSGGRVLYSLNGAGRTIDAFRVDEDGALDALASVGGLPAGANGLAVR